MPQTCPTKLDKEPGFLEHCVNNARRPGLMRIIELLLVLCTTLSLALRMNAEPSNSVSTAQILQEAKAKHKVPGMAVVVMKDGVVCDRAVAGVRKNGAPDVITTNDLFHIGSCTKSMTATLVATYVEEGRLSWDTTIASVLPELKGKMNEAYEKVTIEQLLTHRGGVPGSPPTLAWIQAWGKKGTPTQQRYEFIKAVLSKAPEAKPGEKFIYSNQGYAIAGAMLEKITGQAWETLMTNKIFKPLSMDTTGFSVPGTEGKIDQPWGHAKRFGKIRALQEDNPPAIGPAGTVHGSLDDIARFALAHMKGEREGGIVKRETFRKLHTAPQGGDYAFGWGCSKTPQAGTLLSHAGSNTMFYLLMWVAPEKDLLIITAVNMGGDPAEQATLDVTRALRDKWLTVKGADLH